MDNAPSLWRHRDFLKLWGGQTVSEVGSAVSQIALPLVAVLTLHATTFEVGALAAATTAAFLLVGLPAGAIVDRLRRRPVLVAADVGRALLYGSIPVSAVLGRLTLAQLYVVAVLGGVLTVFFDVAYQSYLPALVDREQLLDGNSKLAATDATAAIAGPGIGGALVGWLGPAKAITADALSYVVSVVSILSIRTPEPRIEKPDGGHRPLRKDVAEGLGFVVRHPLLSRIAGCTGTSNLGSSMAYSIAAVFMVRELHMSPRLIGVVFMAGGAGGVIGAALSGKVARHVGVGRAIVLGDLVGSLGPFLWPLAPRHGGWLLLMAGAFLQGIGVPIYNVAQVSFRQAVTPPRLQGRMNASMRFIVWGTMPIGGLLGGALGTWLHLRPTLWIGAVISGTSLLWVALSPVRSIRELPEQVEDAVVSLPHPSTVSPPEPVQQ